MTKEKIDKILYESSQEDWIIDDELGVFTYKNDVSLCIEKAELDTHIDFNESWATNHPDKKATVTTYIIKYNRNFIERKTLVNVDGYRATLPMPKSIDDLVVTKEQVNFAKIVNIGNRVEEYLSRSDIRIE